MNREIYISEQAFLAIVFAAAEVYRRESYGLLFGYALPGKVIVEGALPYQTAERRFSEVSLFERQNKVIQSLIARFPKHEYLGEFHSHADYRGREAQAALTPEDLDSMTPGEIAIVVAVNPRLRKRPWSTNADGSLSGTLGAWRFTIAAFALAPTRLSPPQRGGMPLSPSPPHRGGMPLSPSPPHRGGMPLSPSPPHRGGMPSPPPRRSPLSRSFRVPRSEFRVASRPRILRARVSCPYAVGLLRNA
jgi:proteasome lid subunit RPN8/RPN11